MIDFNKEMMMAKLLIPGVDPDADAIFREGRGLGPNDPAPVSLESYVLPRNHARNLEMQREMATKSAPRSAALIKPAGRSAAGTARSMSNVEAARAALDKLALGADIATVGLAAGGITAPIATAAKGVGWAAEAGLGAVNFYDGRYNGNWGPWEAQVAALPKHIIPGGRALQKGMKIARGPTGLLRDGGGRFRSSVLNNKGLLEAGQAATENYIDAISDRIFNAQK